MNTPKLSHDPQTISAVLSCTAKELPEVAKRLGLKETEARVLRCQWQKNLKRFRGHGTKQLQLLENIDPRTTLIRTHCSKCSTPISYRAGFMLKVLKRAGWFQQNTMCTNCYIATQKKEEPASEQVKEEKPVQAPKVTPVRPMSTKPIVKGLTYNPFSVLGSLKIEKS